MPFAVPLQLRSARVRGTNSLTTYELVLWERHAGAVKDLVPAVNGLRRFASRTSRASARECSRFARISFPIFCCAVVVASSDLGEYQHLFFARPLYLSLSRPFYRFNIRIALFSAAKQTRATCVRTATLVIYTRYRET